MLLIIFWLLVQVKIPKHRTIFHVMTVYDEICAWRVYIRNFFHIKAAIWIFFPVKVMVKIIFIVIALHDRRINCRIWDRKPADEIAIFCIECLKMFHDDRGICLIITIIFFIFLQNTFLRQRGLLLYIL